MNRPSTLRTAALAVVATLAASGHAADAPESVQTIWNAGQTYETIVKATIYVTNAELTATPEYKGSYSIPSLMFRPVMRFRTDDIRKSGVNYYGRRIYEMPQQVVDGIEGIKWNSKHMWVDPRRWVAAWRMGRNKELKEWKRQNKELVRQIKEKGVACEVFSVFHTDDHKEVPFNPDETELLLQWSESSVANFHNGEQGDLIVKTYLTDKGRSSDQLETARGDIPPAGFEFQRKIVAECNVLASVLYDDPSGGRRSLMRNKKEWRIDAGALNRGLLFYGGMDRFVYFDGSLKVQREPVRPSDCKRLGLIPFEGDKIIVVNSTKAHVGYHIGGRWHPFPMTISYENRDDPDKNAMEFWFDSNNNVLRYAHIRIVKNDYDGDIPNPRLGKMTTALRGSVKGRVAFETEYWTAVNQPLPDME